MTERLDGLRFENQSPNRTSYNSYSGEPWNICQTLWRFSPLAFASSDLEARFRQYLGGVRLWATTVSFLIGLIVGGWKLYHYGLWNSPRGEMYQRAVIAAAAFYMAVPLVIRHHPAFFANNYDAFMIVSRAFKMGLSMSLQQLTIARQAEGDVLDFTHDVFVTSLAEVLFLMPLTDPMSCLPGLITQLIMLALAVARNGAPYMATYVAKSPVVRMASHVPLAPSLGSLSGLPRKGAVLVKCGVAEGVGCAAVLSQLQLNASALSFMLSLVFEIGVRRGFLQANLHLLGRNAAQRVQLWPLGDSTSLSMCTIIIAVFVQGYLLLVELLVWG